MIIIGKHFVKVWLNTGGCPGGIAVRLDAGAGNRQGIGATVMVEVDDVQTIQWMLPDTASSSSQHALYFGLDGHPHADQVMITWPDGSTEVLEQVESGTTLHLSQ